MEVIKFVDGKYSYITDGVSGNIVTGEKADEIVNNPNCILYSPMITSYNLDVRTEKNLVSLYNNRIRISSRGGKWNEEFCIRVDDIFYIHGAGFKYVPWYYRWEKRQLSPNELIQYLNLIEQEGVSYVRDMYLNLLKQELNEIRNVQCLNADISEQLEKILDGLQRLNYKGEISSNISKIISSIREIQEKALILVTEIAKIEEHYKLYE